MTIAILAHDSRKELALQFCTAYSAILSKNVVIATGTTGRMLAQTTGLPVHCYLSGKLGGVQQITSRVACDEVDLVLFFRDPLKVDASSLNEQNLLRLCDMHGVPLPPTLPLPRCCCAVWIRAIWTTARACTRRLWSQCPYWNTAPCAETDFVYRGKQRRRNVLRRCCFVYSCLPSGRNT